MDNIREYSKGDVICKEGAYELWMYEVLSGSVSVYKDYQTENENKIADIDSGFLGEMGMINSLPRNATVVANENTKLAIIDEDDFIKYFDDPKKVEEVMICLVKRMNEINANYIDACATVDGYLKCEEKKNRDAGLVEKMKKFAEAFRR